MAMSTRVVWGLAPAGKPHPTIKWSLLIALLVVVVLGVPKIAAAGAPAVENPTGPGESYSDGTYYFTGQYTFRSTAYCSDGHIVTDAHSYGFTANFIFYGSSDGSLYVSIDGGSPALLDSCGDPNTTSLQAAASFAVQMGSPPTPTPTPTPPPTHTPTPTPSSTPAPGRSSSGSTPARTTTTPGAGGGDASSPQPSTSQTSGQPAATQTPTPTPTASPAQPQTSPSPSPTSSATPAAAAPSRSVPPRAPSSVSKLHVPALIMFLAAALLLALPLALHAPWRGAISAWARRRWIRLEPYFFRLRRRLASTVPVHGHDVPKRRGLSHHKHSGRLLAHHHTSYASLTFLLLIATGVAIGAAYVSQADSSAQTQVTLTVLGPPPTQAATISQPPDGQIETSPTVTVQGTCPQNVFVEIWRNGVFAGSSACDSSGLYSVLISLTSGTNQLMARVVDALGQYGPDSSISTVTYNPITPPPPTPTPTPSPSPTQTPTPSIQPSPSHGSTPSKSPSNVPKASTSPTPSPKSTSGTTGPAPLLITSAIHNEDTDPGVALTWQLKLSGGTGPYLVDWQWQDGGQTVYDQPAPGTMSATHTYKNPGYYNLVVRVTDAHGNVAVLQVVTVVNGVPSPATASGDRDSPGQLIAIWPLLFVTGLVVFSFWLGESHVLAHIRFLMRRKEAAV